MYQRKAYRNPYAAIFGRHFDAVQLHFSWLVVYLVFTYCAGLFGISDKSMKQKIKIKSLLLAWKCQIG